MIFSYQRSVIISIIQTLVCVLAFYVGGTIALEFHVPKTKWTPSDSYGWHAYKLLVFGIYGTGLIIVNLLVARTKSKRSFWILYIIYSMIIILIHLNSWKIMPYRTLLLMFSGLAGIWSIIAVQWTLNRISKRNRNDLDESVLDQTQA